mmetsp:Transcript_27486/g.58436  ORF Transcript_27486/g.58436 Transcript_27486/m.58436 type:complete len:91 (-) Transcript_27486:231-503(-)
MTKQLEPLHQPGAAFAKAATRPIGDAQGAAAFIPHCHRSRGILGFDISFGIIQRIPRVGKPPHLPTGRCHVVCEASEEECASVKVQARRH